MIGNVEIFSIIRLSDIDKGGFREGKRNWGGGGVVAHPKFLIPVLIKILI